MSPAVACLRRSAAGILADTVAHGCDAMTERGGAGLPLGG